MIVIEAFMIIGGIIGVAAVGLFISGRMDRWWTSAIYGILTVALGVLMVAGIYALTIEQNPIAVLWYARLSAVSVVIALVCLYFLFQELNNSSVQRPFDERIDKAVFIVGIIIIFLCFSPAVIVHASPDVTRAGGTLIETSWGMIFYILFIIAVIARIISQFIENMKGAYKQRQGGVDVRYVLVRTSSYIFSLISVALIFYITALLLRFIFPEHTVAEAHLFITPTYVVAAVLTALAFYPLKKWLYDVFDNLFYPDNYSVSDFIAMMNTTLNSSNDLRTILRRSARLIANTIKTNQAFFVVELLNNHYITDGTEDHSRVTLGEFVISTSTHKENKQPLVILPMQLQATDPFRRMMISHRLGLVLQLNKGNVVVGYLCLGRPHRKMYTRRDIRALRAIASELATAIQNAVSIEEVRELNNSLEQRIDSATKELQISNSQLQRLDEAKDEFISMASHQLRTPLTSIKGYISMVLEGDAGKVTKEQKHYLSEAFLSSERMVRLISDFLNVSRLRTGKFVIEKRPVDLAKLVKHEIDGLTQNAASRGVTFRYKRPNTIPIIDLDENKIQQVIMNFADNAIYYSKENSSVEISLKKIPGYIEFKVVDTGIGVPKDEQDQLFSKFFRASNARQARPDGNGVGLFLAKKVIEDHGGIIIFESKEGEGSTFGFLLPLPQHLNKTTSPS